MRIVAALRLSLTSLTPPPFQLAPPVTVSDMYTVASLSTSRPLVHLHSGVICFFAGLGFPYFVLSMVRKLKFSGKLDAESLFSGFYEF